MTWSGNAVGVPMRIPLLMNHRPSVAAPLIIGTSKKVTSVLEPIVAGTIRPRFDWKARLVREAHRHERDLARRLRSTAVRPVRVCPLAAPARKLAFAITRTPTRHAAVRMRAWCLEPPV